MTHVFRSLGQLWYFGTTSRQLGDNLGITLRYLGDSSKTTLMHLGYNFWTTLGQLLDYFGTTMPIVTSSGAYLCPVGSKWPFLSLNPSSTRLWVQMWKLVHYIIPRFGCLSMQIWNIVNAILSILSNANIVNCQLSILSMQIWKLVHYIIPRFGCLSMMS